MQKNTSERDIKRNGHCKSQKESSGPQERWKCQSSFFLRARTLEGKSCSGWRRCGQLSLRLFLMVSADAECVVAQGLLVAPCFLQLRSFHLYKSMPLLGGFFCSPPRFRIVLTGWLDFQPRAVS